MWWQRGFVALIVMAAAACSNGDPADVERDPDDPPTTVESTEAMDLEERRRLLTELNTTDVEVAMTATTDSVAAGETFAYDVTVTNHGPNPAGQPKLSLALSGPVVPVENDAACLVRNAQLVCQLAEIEARRSRDIRFTVRVMPSAEPGAVTSVATIQNLAGADPDLTNNTTVLDIALVAPGD